MKTQVQELITQPKIQYPFRPGLGTLGKKVLIQANYFKFTKVFYK